MVEKITDATLEAEGLPNNERTRMLTWVIINEVNDGNWGAGGGVVRLADIANAFGVDAENPRAPEPVPAVRLGGDVQGNRRAPVRTAWKHLNDRDYGYVLDQFAPAFEYSFAGDHALGGARHTREAMEALVRAAVRRSSPESVRGRTTCSSRAGRGTRGRWRS